MNAKANTGQYAFEGLDRVFHEKARLGIVTCLAKNRDGLLFPELKALCNLTDGNLNRHLHQLEESGIVFTEKRLEKNRMQTMCRLTLEGSKRFNAYLDHLESALEQARSAQSRTKAKTREAPRKLTPRVEGR